ncbi:MAG: T9SS type A sorting domain-containing protein [candidate division WOR-3 bacterium]|nr:T9SS type A sorting domain-containing protein [candidate division WOR-3 bacterium]
MKFTVVKLAILSLIPVLLTAGAVDTMWLRIYPGSDSVSGNFNQAGDIGFDPQGNIIVCGAGEKGTAGSTDMLVAKFNPWGETLWVRSYGGIVGSEEDMAHALAVDSLGNIYVVGVTAQSVPYDLDITWLKFSPEGNLLWARRTMLPDDDIGYDIEIGLQGDIYVCGAVTDTHFVLSRYWLARINPVNGDTVWTRSYILDTLAFNAKQDRHPDFVMSDWDRWDNCAAALAISPDSGHIVTTGFGYSDSRSYQVWTMKFLPDGTRRWQHEHYWSLDYDDAGFDVAVANNGYIFVAGFEENDYNWYDATLLRYSPTGGTPSVRRVNDPMDDEDYFFAVTLDDSNPQNVYATGAYYQSTTTGFDIITYKANMALTARWGTAGAIFSSNLDDYGFAITYNQGKVYVAGRKGNDLVILCYRVDNAVPHDTLWSFSYNSPYNQEDFAAAVAVRDSNSVYFAGQAARSGLANSYTDLVAGRLFYPYPDVGVDAILAPAGVVGYQETITPQVRFVNSGNSLARFNATLRIGSDYSQTVSRSAPLYPGDSCVLIFPDWVAHPLGQVTVACTVAMNGDREPLNNRLTGTVEVVLRDAGCLRIVAPADTVDSGVAVTPQAWVRNYGTVQENIGVRFRIGDGYVNQQTVLVAPGESALVQFALWRPAVPGTWVLRCSTMLTGDVNHGNDFADGQIFVRSGGGVWPAGWQEVASVLSAPSGRAVKDGGWLAFDPEQGRIYAVKGYKTGDFYVYDIYANRWATLTPWPAGTEGKLPYKGSAGCYGDGRIWAVKGYNTPGFWCYEISTGEWRQLQNILPGNSGKYPKGGTDLVYAEVDGVGYVYLLKGYKCDFMRYNTVTGVWEPLPDAPGGIKPKWDKGSWLAFDGDNTLYAHKAKYHEFWTFDVRAGQWSLTQLPNLPFASQRTGKSKKSKDGGAGFYYNGFIYALKGGNTCEFYRFDCAGQTWIELDPMPEIGSTGRKKRVKAGGDIVAGVNACWALKGNKTLEFWRYGLLLPVEPDRGAHSAQSGEVAGAGCWQLMPVYTRAGVGFRYSAPEPVRIQVQVYDRSGRLVLTLPEMQITGTGTVKPDLSGLSAGVYLLKLEADDGTVQQKKLILRPSAEE